VDVTIEFVTSAAGPDDFPRDGLSEIALIGRSNVGKSSLINAATRSRAARTSAAPGKTRLVNLYRVTRGRKPPFYLADLPGYGYARGGRTAAAEFDALTRAYFARQAAQTGGSGQAGRVGNVGALLLVDARHPGLESDREAWRWLGGAVGRRAIVATKVDKLARGERLRALRTLESVFDDAVLPVSAASGEGLDELWKLIDRLANSPNPNPRSSSPPGAPPRPRKSP
jgi:GTP-binding protein